VSVCPRIWTESATLRQKFIGQYIRRNIPRDLNLYRGSILFKSFYKCKKNSYRTKIHLCTPLPLSNDLWNYVEAQECRINNSTPEIRKANTFSPAFSRIFLLLALRDEILKIYRLVRTCLLCLVDVLTFFSWRSLLLATFQHWGKNCNDMSATLQQSTEVAKQE